MKKRNGIDSIYKGTVYCKTINCLVFNNKIVNSELVFYIYRITGIVSENTVDSSRISIRFKNGMIVC